jgi:phage-related protein
MNTEKVRTVFLYKNFFSDFFAIQRQKSKDKIIWTLRLIETLQHVPETYLKHLEGTAGLYEIRVQQGMENIRIFCFFDQGNLVVLANGFHKKSQKTPKQEIRKAMKIKSAYEAEK